MTATVNYVLEARRAKAEKLALLLRTLNMPASEVRAGLEEQATWQVMADYLDVSLPSMETRLMVVEILERGEGTCS